jgi:predicted dehydrogenase
MIRVGVIGYGYSAKTFHIPLISTSESLELAAISSSQGEVVAKTHPDATVFKSANELIESAQIELAVITAPNDVHFELAKQCLDNGIHVILEKPMVTTSVEGEQLVKLAKARNLLLSVFHNRRWDGDFLTVKKILDDRLVGEVRYFESHFDRFRPAVRQRWREQPGNGAGVWFDLGSHLLDQAVCIFGRPEAVTARCLPLREGSGTTDYFHVLLHYKNLEVVLHASPFSPAPNNRFRIEGDKGCFVKYGLDPQEGQLKTGMAPSEPAYGIEAPEHYGRFYSESASAPIETEAGCYPNYYSQIVAAIKYEAPNPVDPSDAVAVLKLLELAELSSTNGETLKLSNI